MIDVLGQMDFTESLSLPMFAEVTEDQPDTGIDLVRGF